MLVGCYSEAYEFYRSKALLCCGIKSGLTFWKGIRSKVMPAISCDGSIGIQGRGTSYTNRRGGGRCYDVDIGGKANGDFCNALFLMHKTRF